MPSVTVISRVMGSGSLPYVQPRHKRGGGTKPFIGPSLVLGYCWPSAAAPRGGALRARCLARGRGAASATGAAAVRQIRRGGVAESGPCSKARPSAGPPGAAGSKSAGRGARGMLGPRAAGELSRRAARPLLESARATGSEAARRAGRPAIEDRLAALNARAAASGEAQQPGTDGRRLVDGPRAGLRHHHAAYRRCGWRRRCGAARSRLACVAAAAGASSAAVSGGTLAGVQQAQPALDNSQEALAAGFAAESCSGRQPEHGLRSDRRPWQRPPALLAAARGCPSGAGGATGGFTTTARAVQLTTTGRARQPTAPAGALATTGPTGGREAMAGAPAARQQWAARAAGCGHNLARLRPRRRGSAARRAAATGAAGAATAGSRRLGRQPAQACRASASASFFLARMAFITSPGLETCERSILGAMACGAARGRRRPAARVRAQIAREPSPPRAPRGNSSESCRRPGQAPPIHQESAGS